MEWHLFPEINLTSWSDDKRHGTVIRFFVYFESQLRDLVITLSKIYGEKVPFYSAVVILLLTKLTTC